jgi:hypothetical protein
MVKQGNTNVMDEYEPREQDVITIPRVPLCCEKLID